MKQKLPLQSSDFLVPMQQREKGGSGQHRTQGEFGERTGEDSRQDIKDLLLTPFALVTCNQPPDHDTDQRIPPSHALLCSRMNPKVPLLPTSSFQAQHGALRPSRWESQGHCWSFCLAKELQNRVDTVWCTPGVWIPGKGQELEPYSPWVYFSLLHYEHKLAYCFCHKTYTSPCTPSSDSRIRATANQAVICRTLGFIS